LADSCGERLPKLPLIDFALLMPEHCLLNTRRIALIIHDRFQAANGLEEHYAMANVRLHANETLRRYRESQRFPAAVA
jgi:hypothetical protein